ncbi:MAG: MOSC domain-containing protein, partial [Actinomycetota bacterium]|nr:MOSC domain-containing protein [Actinomycetota bacterium]
GEPLQEVEHASVRSNHGLVGNAERGGRRQVTVLSAEDWETANAQAGSELDPSARRANILVTGLGNLVESTGQVLKVGGARIQVTGETRPCSLMDAAHQGLRAAMEVSWRGGVHGIVLNDADLAVGDEVSWEG